MTNNFSGKNSSKDSLSPSIPFTFSLTATDNVGRRGGFNSGDITDDSRPRFSGTAVPGEIVWLYDENGRSLGSTSANIYGDWSLEINSPLSDGTHTITAKTATQISNNNFVLTVIVPENTPLKINSHAIDNSPGGREFSTDDTIRGQQPTFTGTSGSEEIVTLYDNNGVALGSVKADLDGKWQIQVNSPLQDGRNEVVAKTATQISDGFAFIIDNNVPVTMNSWAYADANGLTKFYSGETIDDRKPTFKGKAGIGDIVTIYDENNRALGSVKVVNGGGNWVLELTEPLSDGTHTITAKTHSGSSEPFLLTVTALEIPPLIMDDRAYDNQGSRGYFVAGATTDDTRPTFSGKAASGEVVALFDSNNRKLGSVRADANGFWSLEIQLALSSGLNTVVAKTANQTTEGFTFTVDTSVPVTFNSYAYDNAGSKRGYFYNGSTTDDVRPTFSGRAGANEIVTLVDENNRALGSVRASATGNWSIEILESLSSGKHSVFAKTATQTSDSFVLTVEGDIPVSLNNYAYDNAGVMTTFRSGDTTDDARPTFSGKAYVGDIVTLVDENNRPLGSVKVTSTSGDWSIEISETLSNGTHTVTARTNHGSSQPFLLTVKVPDNALLVIDERAYDNQGARGYFSAGATTDDSRPTFSGKAAPWEVVTLVDENNRSIGSVRAGYNGRWSLEIQQPLSNGLHNVTAKTATQASQTFTFNVETSVPLVLNNYAYDNVGSNKGYFYSGNTTDDMRPTFSGSAGAGELVTLVDEKNRVIGSVRASTSGNWTIEVMQPLDNGSHTVTAKSGNQVSKSFSFNVASEISVTMNAMVYDSQGSRKGYFYDGDTTDDTRPLFSGTAAPHQLVELIDQQGNSLGSVVANQWGVWSLELTVPLKDGTHTVRAKTATQTTAGISFVVDTQVPVTLNASAYDNVGSIKGYFRSGSSTDDARPELSGTAKVGETVTIFDELNQSLGSVKVTNQDGSWVLEITEALSTGTHTLTARTESSSSQGFILTVNKPVTTPVTLDKQAYDNQAVRGYFGNGEATDDVRPTFSGKAGVAELVTLFDENGRSLGSVRAGPDGKWSLEISQPLSYGTHTVLARTESEMSDTFEFRVITPAETEVGILSRIYDDVQKSNVSPDYPILDSTPTFRGISGAFEIVTLYDEKGNNLGSVQATAQGEWRMEVESPFSNGMHTVTAKTATQISNVLQIEIHAEDNMGVIQTLYEENSAQNLHLSLLLQDSSEYIFNKEIYSEDNVGLTIEDLAPTNSDSTGSGVMVLHSVTNLLPEQEEYFTM